MIHPINALTPKVLFKGEESSDSKEAAKLRAKKSVAYVNAMGISAILGAATTAIARSNTSSWKNAGFIGVGVSLISAMFLLPGFLYKAGINTTKSVDTDVFVKGNDSSKKFLAELSEFSTTTKNTAKSALKTFSKV